MMNCKVALTVPSTTGINKPAKKLSAEYVKKAEWLFAVMFKGFTSLAGKGGWMSKDFGVVVEDITIVSASTTKAQLASAIASLKLLALEIKRAMNQECVALEVNGTLYLIADEDVDIKLAA